MSIVPAGGGAAWVLANWLDRLPRWLWTAVGAFLMFNAGSVVMAGAFAWLLERQPSFADELPEVGWRWVLNVGLYLGLGVWVTAYAYRKGATQTIAVDGGAPDAE
jgi:hypothetical protein